MLADAGRYSHGEIAHSLAPHDVPARSRRCDFAEIAPPDDRAAVAAERNHARRFAESGGLCNGEYRQMAPRWRWEILARQTRLRRGLRGQCQHATECDRRRERRIGPHPQGDRVRHRESRSAILPVPLPQHTAHSPRCEGGTHREISRLVSPDLRRDDARNG